MKDKLVKIGLIVLAVFSVCFASVNANFSCSPMTSYSSVSYDTKVTRNFSWSFDGRSYDSVCIINNSTNTTFKVNSVDDSSTASTVGYKESMCYTKDELPNNAVYLYRIDSLIDSAYVYYPSSCLAPVMTSLECQTNYNLIPIEEVDSSYCQSNNLCPVGGTPSDCPNVGVSNLFINDIFHPGAFNIIMNIPEEIDWDYAYTNSGSNINIDVVGYNQDTEYINGLIDVQSYQPTTDDFTKVFTNFGNFGGLLIACLFIILVFYFVKKMFK